MDFQDSMNILHKHIQAASRHTIELFSKIDTLHVSSEMANEIKNSMDQITSVSIRNFETFTVWLLIAT